MTEELGVDVVTAIAIIGAVLFATGLALIVVAWRSSGSSRLTDVIVDLRSRRAGSAEGGSVIDVTDAALERVRRAEASRRQRLRDESPASSDDRGAGGDIVTF